MRRLLASVAFAAALLAPSAALAATGKPQILTPAAVSASNAAAPVTVHLSWTSVGALITYHVFRDTIAQGASCSAAHTGADITPTGLLDTTQYDDAVSAEAIYCYWVQADDGLSGATDSDPVQFTYDVTPPAVPVVTQTGGNGCSLFTLVTATAADNLGPVTITTGGPFPYSPAGAPFEDVNPTVTATDAAGNFSSVNVPGKILDPTRPPAPVLEVDTDPSQLKATLSWDSVTSDGAPVVSYHVRTRGPSAAPDVTVGAGSRSLVFGGLQVDATYEYSLFATDACGDSLPSVRLVRLNDTTPPSSPLVAQPAFDPSTHTVTLSWIPSGDNVQVDHYEILRDGVPLAATDASVFTDAQPVQDALLSYVVRAVDTNGNRTDSAPATIMTRDWTAPTAPVLTLDPPQGTTETLHWKGATDNVGVVRYDILREDNKVKGSVTGGVRGFKDLNVPPGVHTWRVRAVDDAGNFTDSVGQTQRILKPVSRARVLSLTMVGGGRRAARYSLAGPARLLLDLRVIGTLPKAELRLYLQRGKGRITVWRGVPGSSAPRLRLHSALARRGYVTIHLGRSLHAGRIRLVLIVSGRMVIVATGKHKPAVRAG